VTQVSLQYHSGLTWRWSGGMGWAWGQIDLFIFSNFKFLACTVLFISLLAFNMCVSNFTVNKVFRPTHLSIDHLCISIVPLRHRQWRNVILLKGEAKMEIIIIIIIIVIYCNWVVTRWQWLFYIELKWTWRKYLVQFVTEIWVIFVM